MTSYAREALQRLKEGNRRFSQGTLSTDHASLARRAALVAEQRPFAIVIGCSDSRVPAEIIFDQGLGDLFVIRVAGNIVAPSQIGSVEFAAARFGTPLVVVLGHTQCGAVQATIDEMRRPTNHSSNLRSIVSRIRPSLATLMEAPVFDDDAELMRQAVRANVRAAANHLRHGSAILEQLIADGKLMVVGAEYSLETGVVSFFQEDVA